MRLYRQWVQESGDDDVIHVFDHWWGVPKPPPTTPELTFEQWLAAGRPRRTVERGYNYERAIAAIAPDDIDYRQAVIEKHPLESFEPLPDETPEETAERHKRYLLRTLALARFAPPGTFEPDSPTPPDTPAPAPDEPPPGAPERTPPSWPGWV